MKYQVVGECAHVVVPDISGRMTMVLLYKGAPVPEDVDPERLQHLLDSRLVVEVVEDTVPIAPNVPVGPGSSVEHPADRADDVDPEVAKRRTAAAAKLDEIGGTPDGRHGDDVWVEYAVRQGFDYVEASKAGKDELRKVLTK